MNLRSAAISAWYGVSTSVSAFLRRLPSLKVLRVRIQDHDEDIDASSLNRSFLDTSWNGSYEILIAVMNSATPSLIELDLSVAGISRTALGWLDLPDSAQNFRQFSSLKVLRITHSCLCDQTVPELPVVTSGHASYSLGTTTNRSSHPPGVRMALSARGLSA